VGEGKRTVPVVEDLDRWGAVDDLIGQSPATSTYKDSTDMELRASAPCLKRMHTVCSFC